MHILRDWQHRMAEDLVSLLPNRAMSLDTEGKGAPRQTGGAMSCAQHLALC